MDIFIIVRLANISVSESSANADLDTKQTRLEHPSGFLHLLQYESVPILIDALLDLPPGREFTRTELAEHAGVTRQTVSSYADLLLKTDVIEPVENTSPQRYQLAESEVAEELFELNSALNGAVPK